jgi:hypothetical protein
MATYKVLQDIEADDKLFGPLSLKQFIFAIIAAGFIFVAFITATKTHQIFSVLPFLPFIGVFGILAAPIGGYQTTDVWLAARLRFFLKPHTRVWFQSEVKELVRITVPKREEKIYTDGLNEEQVRSRLKALADTLDSRGWALKSLDVNEPTAPDYIGSSADRLVSSANLPKTEVPVYAHAEDDILNEKDNRVAHNFSAMVAAASEAQKQAAIERMNQARNNPLSAKVNKQKEALEEKEIDSFIHKKKDESDAILKSLTRAHHKVITPLSEIETKQPDIEAQAVTTPQKTVIINETRPPAVSSDTATMIKDENGEEVTIQLR